MADYLYVLVFLTCGYWKCLMKDVVRFSRIEVSVFTVTKTGLEFSGLLFAVPGALS